MSISSNKPVHVVALEVWFDNDKLYARLSDGREIGVPLEWFPRLKKAETHKRANWRFIGGGIGVHWPDLDEDIAVQSLIQPEAYLLSYNP
ncbi:MAG: DUF2442 domain-containing protein [Eubacteriales bacterium]